MRSIQRVLVTALVVSIAACGPNSGDTGDDDDDDDVPRIDSGGDNGDGIPAAEQCRKMDLIFVIDDSGSMAEEQANLATNFPMFAQVLNTYTISTGEDLDYRAAVTTTGITGMYTITPPFPGFPPITMSQTGMDGRFRQACGMTRGWLERTDPDMANTFACAADVGTNGPGLEMPLRATELATMLATNPGFVREDALLGVVILTDEEDCSRRSTNFMTMGDDCVNNGDPDLTPVADVIASLDAVKGDRGRWAAAVIAGQTSCSSAFGMAEQSVRLQQFAQQAGTNVVFGDICGGNLAPVLSDALDNFQAACDNFPIPLKPSR
jgi:hypothetical protein